MSDGPYERAPGEPDCPHEHSTSEQGKASGLQVSTCTACGWKWVQGIRENFDVEAVLSPAQYARLKTEMPERWAAMQERTARRAAHRLERLESLRRKMGPRPGGNGTN